MPQAGLGHIKARPVGGVAVGERRATVSRRRLVPAVSAESGLARGLRQDAGIGDIGLALQGRVGGSFRASREHILSSNTIHSTTASADAIPAAH